MSSFSRETVKVRAATIRPIFTMKTSISPPELPENLSFYSFQIAGHHYSKQKDENFGVLLCEKSGHVLKPLQKPPRGKSEVTFYENVWKEDQGDVDTPRRKTLRELRAFVPRYYGLRQVTANATTATFLELENLTLPFEKPCVVDIKIGARTWDPLATQEKIDYEKSKYPYAQVLGFRFLGTVVYKEATDSYEHRDKDWGKMLNEHQVLPALKSFFPHETRSCTILSACILRKLHQLLRVFSVQHSFTFYSSSLLITYDGRNLSKSIDKILSSTGQHLRTKNVKDTSSSADSNEDTSVLTKFDALNYVFTSKACNKSAVENNQLYSAFDQLFVVKMIDFTHVFEMQQEQENHEEPEKKRLDENYLHGLRNLIKYLTRFLDSLV